MRTRDVVLVGASAGGLDILCALVAGLPADLPATVLVVLHVPAAGAGALPAILDRSGPLPARVARHGEGLHHRQVLVAGPDRHLLVEGGRGRTTEHPHVVLGTGPRENGHRPSVDALFRSAADALGPRAIGVVVSGALDDGAAGLVALRAAGGVAVVQDPADAAYDGMPRAAIAAADPEHVVPAALLPDLLVRLVHQDVPDSVPHSVPDGRSPQVPLAPTDLGEPTPYSCPECSGVLARHDRPGPLSLRCRVGHVWSPESLQDRQSQELDGALWSALRTLQERSALARELSALAREAGRELTAGRLLDRALAADAAAGTLRTLLADQTARPEAPRNETSR